MSFCFLVTKQTLVEYSRSLLLRRWGYVQKVVRRMDGLNKIKLGSTRILIGRHSCIKGEKYSDASRVEQSRCLQPFLLNSLHLLSRMLMKMHCESTRRWPTLLDSLILNEKVAVSSTRQVHKTAGFFFSITVLEEEDEENETWNVPPC